MQQFHKYEALGNDYLVLDPASWALPLTPERIRRLCDRHFGLGSDGILWGPEAVPGNPEAFGVRIFNPDGSEAEKSGNGLRIFARFLLDTGRVRERGFIVRTLGGDVECRILEDGAKVRVAMGRVSFRSQDVPVTGPEREMLNEELDVAGQRLTFCAASVGNPHCVVLGQPVTPETACRLGPLIENHPAFPKRTNVQFLETLDRGTIRIEIWERGAGYTLASGSSASAAAAVARRLGFCDERITVRMSGGNLNIELAPDYFVTLTGPVRAVALGNVAPDLMQALDKIGAGQH